MNAAEKIAEMLGNDGQIWETADGRSFDDLCNEAGAEIVYSARCEQDDDSTRDHDHYVEGTKSGHVWGDPIRYVFPDGSVLVAAGDAWDFEGDEPFSWRG